LFCAGAAGGGVEGAGDGALADAVAWCFLNGSHAVRLRGFFVGAGEGAACTVWVALCGAISPARQPTP